MRMTRIDYNNANEVKQVCPDVADFGPAAESAARAMERQLQELQVQRGVHGEKP